MKKIFVAIALIAGLGTSSVAFANAKTTNEISIQLNVADYTPIEVKDLPQAIQDALTKNCYVFRSVEQPKTTRNTQA